MVFTNLFFYGDSIYGNDYSIFFDCKIIVTNFIII